MRHFLSVFFAICTFLLPVSIRAAVTDYTLQPSAQAPINALTTFTIKFPEAKFLGMYGSNLHGVTLTNVDDPAEVYVPAKTTYSASLDSNSQSFALKRKGTADSEVVSITKPGKYKLHIPSECFELCGNWYVNLGWSKEIDVTYTIASDGTSGFDKLIPTDQIAISPNSGKVLEFNSVRLTFPVNGDNVLRLIDINTISMTRREDGKKYLLCDCDTDYESILTLRFRPSGSLYDIAEPITEPGTYDIDIPAGIATLADSQMFNPQMRITYTVTGMENTEFGKWVLTPSEGVYSKISDITISFPDLVSGLNFPEGKTDITNYLNGRITFKKLADDMTYTRSYNVYSATLIDPQTVKLTFVNSRTEGEGKAETIDLAGNYLLDIPTNTFKAKGNDFLFNSNIRAKYTINPGTVDNPMDVFTTNPANNSVVPRMEVFSITFPYLSQGIVYPFNADALRIVNVDNPEEIYLCDGVSVRGNTISCPFATPENLDKDIFPIDKAGTYKVIIPAGVFIDNANRNNVNSEINVYFTVNPALDFLYSVSPANNTSHLDLSEFSFTAGNGVKKLTVKAGAPEVKIVSGDKSFTVKPSQADEKTIIFTFSGTLSLGNWQIVFPKDYFEQTNDDGLLVSNSSEIRLQYTIATAPEIDWQLRPGSGSTVAGLPAIGITPVGDNIRQLNINPSADRPTIFGNGLNFTLTPEIYNFSISLLAPDDMILTPGDYTLTVPSGLFTVSDNNGLSASNGLLSATYHVTDTSKPEIANGIFFLNEGAFGLDFGSINHLSDDYKTMDYEVFRNSNQGRTLGTTSQYAELYGSNLLVSSKQASYGSSDGLLTIADATSLKFRHDIKLTGTDARAICAVSDDKAYIGTTAGIFTVNTAAGTLGSAVKGTAHEDHRYTGQFGDMVKFQGKVFAVRQNEGVYVIDPQNDVVTDTLRIPAAVAPFVTADGKLFIACSSDSVPFVRINPTTLSANSTPFVGAGHPAIQDQWLSWRKAPLACSINGNRVYYITKDAEGRYISSYNLDDGTFSPNFIALPILNGRQMVVYGSAVSVDPLTGYIVIQAVAEGGGTAYRTNRIYFANTRNGAIDDNLTFALEDNYWFPAMAFYPVSARPIITDLPPINIAFKNDEFCLNLAELTTLAVGNPSLIDYSAEIADTRIATIHVDSSGNYIITGLAEGTTQLTLTADYRGLSDTATIRVIVGTSAVDEISASDYLRKPADVYNLQGMLIVRNATEQQIKALPTGIYIINGKKIIL